MSAKEGSSAALDRTCAVSLQNTNTAAEVRFSSGQGGEDVHNRRTPSELLILLARRSGTRFRFAVGVHWRAAWYLVGQFNC